MMSIETLTNILDSMLNSLSNTSITVHTGGHDWEEIVDVVYCSDCRQYHIISERVAKNLEL